MVWRIPLPRAMPQAGVFGTVGARDADGDVVAPDVGAPEVGDAILKGSSLGRFSFRVPGFTLPSSANPMHQLVIIALGSNLGDRLARLQEACTALRNVAVPGTWRQSSVYQTEPVACPDDSPDFYNAVVSFQFDGSATQLHAHTIAIEQALGRERSGINAPRTIDLDLLVFGNECIDTPDLQIPHPRLHLRRFVLEPMAEIHPEWRLPTQQVAIATLLQQLDPLEPALQRVVADW